LAILLIDSILTHCINQLHEVVERKNEVKVSTNTNHRQLIIQSGKTLHELWKKTTQSGENDSLLAFLNECLNLTTNMIDFIRTNPTNDSKNLINICIDLFTSYQNGMLIDIVFVMIVIDMSIQDQWISITSRTNFLND